MGLLQQSSLLETGGGGVGGSGGWPRRAGWEKGLLLKQPRGAPSTDSSLNRKTDSVVINEHVGFSSLEAVPLVGPPSRLSTPGHIITPKCSGVYTEMFGLCLSWSSREFNYFRSQK